MTDLQLTVDADKDLIVAALNSLLDGKVRFVLVENPETGHFVQFYVFNGKLHCDIPLDQEDIEKGRIRYKHESEMHVGFYPMRVPIDSPEEGATIALRLLTTT